MLILRSSFCNSLQQISRRGFKMFIVNSVNSDYCQKSKINIVLKHTNICRLESILEHYIHFANEKNRDLLCG